MEILYILLVLLITTRIFSELVKRIQFPAILGEIIAGIILGLLFNGFSEYLPILSNLKHNEVFHAITDLSIFFLMLYAGLELHPNEFKEASGNAVWIALGGILLPLILGLGAGWLIFSETSNRFALTLFLGVVLAITAVPIAVKLLMDLGELNSKVGKAIVSAAVIDDVISLLLLAVLTSFIAVGSMPEIGNVLLVSGKIVLFFVVAITLGKYVLPKANKLVFKNILVDEIEISFLLVVALAFSLLAELLGMHFIMGSFVAGLFFVQRNMKKEVFESVKSKIKGISTGFLAPIFFASIGLNMDLTAISEIPWIIVLLIILAIIGKLVGTMIPAYFSGFSKKELLMIGFSMNARGVVSIIVADVVLKAGLFNQPEKSVIVDNMFSAVVIMAVVTTVITPLALRRFLK